MFFSTLQVTFPQALSFRGQIADFMLVFVILSGYLFGPVNGAVIGLIMGLLRDLLAGSIIGVGMLALLYAGILSSLLFARRFHSRITLGFVQVILITFLYKAVGHVVNFIKFSLSVHVSEYFSFQMIVFDSILPQIVINLLVSIPMILMLRYLGPYHRGYARISGEDMAHTEELWQIR